MQGPKCSAYNLLVVYGWADSDRDRAKGQRTNDLVTAAMLEEKDLHKTPTFLTGDFNAKIATLPALRDAVEAGEWIDVGALPHLRRRWHTATGEEALEDRQWPAPHCWAHGAKRPARRTYLFANRRALTMLDGAAVGPFGIFDVHAPLLAIMKPAESVTVRQLRKVASLHPEEFPDATDDEGEAQSTEEDSKQAKEKRRKEKWQQRVQAAMATEFQTHAQRFDALLAAGQTADYWYLRCDCMEDSYVETRGLDQQETRAVKGRGRGVF